MDVKMKEGFASRHGDICAYQPWGPPYDQCDVDAILTDIGLDPCDGGMLIIRRVITESSNKTLVNDEPVDFTATEFRLLAFLASHPGRAFTRQQLLNRVIGDEAIVIDRNIDVHVRAIRIKLGDQRDRIETLRGVGYRFRRDER